VSEDEISRDEERRLPRRGRDLKTKVVMIAFIVGFALLIALNMN
jgi:hypothetical protein